MENKGIPLGKSYGELFNKFNKFIDLCDEFVMTGLGPPQKIKCWEFTDCPPDVMRKCPAVLQNAERRCWLIVGTESKSKNPAPCVDKMGGDCKNCEFYKKVQAEAHQSDTVNVLVVEDENIVAMEIQDRLKRMGYAVCGVVAYGEAAVEEARKKRPDLVLMDIKLKGKMDGVEAAELIQSEIGIPVVFLTANSDDQTFLRAKLTEPFGFLLKPFQERELKTSVDLALYRHKTNASAARRRDREKTLERAKAELMADSNVKNLQTIDEIIIAAQQILRCASEEERALRVSGIVRQAEALKADMINAARISSADNEKLLDENGRLNEGDL